MVRVQILPLPAQRLGDAESTPFVIVFDGIDDGTDHLLTEAALAEMKHTTGAAGVWVIEGTLDIGTPLELTEEQQHTILERLTHTASTTAH